MDGWTEMIYSQWRPQAETTLCAHLVQQITSAFDSLAVKFYSCPFYGNWHNAAWWSKSRFKQSAWKKSPVR